MLSLFALRNESSLSQRRIDNHRLNVIDHLMLREVMGSTDDKTKETPEIPLSAFTPTISPTVDTRTKREKENAMTPEQKDKLGDVLGSSLGMTTQESESLRNLFGARREQEGHDIVTQYMRSDHFKNEIKGHLLRGHK